MAMRGPKVAKKWHLRGAGGVAQGRWYSRAVFSYRTESG